MLYPIYGKDSVDTLFSGWTYSKKSSWHEFNNPDGDVLEIYPEGTYIIKRNDRNGDILQLRIPRTIAEFVDDLNSVGIQAFMNSYSQIRKSRI
jgi:hypothetical protein